MDLYKPSIAAHAFNGILLLVALLLVGLNFSKVKLMDPFRLIVLTLLFAMAVSIHGLSHLGLEYVYHFNPIDILSTKAGQMM
jgi:hypothetical protein